MGGLVAGTAIIDLKKEEPKVKMVALTINNLCNLKCPHCYLQYNGTDNLISNHTIENIMNQDFDHIAIVGMEPFLNKKTIEITSRIATRARDSGKTVSAISNGLGFHMIPENILNLFDFIDLSLDGGPETYQNFRGASFDKIIKNTRYLIEKGARLRIINVLCEDNIYNVNDMIKLEQIFPTELIMFSPYMQSENFGSNSVKTIPVSKILHHLSESKSFLESKVSVFLLDAYHFLDGKESLTDIIQLSKQLGIQHKVHIVPYTPLTLGTIRVTYDGLIMPPSTAMHPALYNNSITIDRTTLNDAFMAFVASEKANLIDNANTIAA